MRQTFLHSNWTFTDVSRKPIYTRSAVQYMPWLPATVPGYVHLDLVANGVNPDPFTEMNELGSRWVDESDWAYRTEFEWKADDLLPHQVLRFEGLDTVAEVFLNGQSIGCFDNMFLPIELPVSGLMQAGTNSLEVRFSSPVRFGEARRSEYFDKEKLRSELRQFDERAFVRKAQYMSAWDWGPRLASCGIWQPVSLLEFSSRITSFSIVTERLKDGSFRVTSKTEVEGSGEISLSFGHHSVTSNAPDVEELDLIITDPELWWPSGMGDQHLYLASASLKGGNEIRKNIGLRTITLDRSQDHYGESFTFMVNGVKVWARGANWIPNDSFPSRVTTEDYRRQARDCKALGMNMLRVWGGGLYELEGFYDACDEAGLLVWQDFTYGCSYYPDDAAACEIARREAEYHVQRLRDRACLALWCGNNENLVMWQTKWGGELSPPRYYGENIYDKVLPEVVARLDPGKSYIASSPIGQSDSEGATANDGGFGDSHYWDVWHGRGDWVHYADSNTRFSSEFGFASSCSLEMWNQTIQPEEWQFDSPSVRWHDKTGKEWEKFFGYVTAHYPTPKTLEEWTYYSQLNQRDALRFGIEHWRRSDYCQGTLIWQFNDCWPVQSWAVQDYLRLLKPAGYELSRLYADRLISLVRTGSEVEIFLVNDGTQDWSGDLTADEISFADDRRSQSHRIPFAIAAGKRGSVGKITSAAPAESYLNVSAGDIFANSFFAEPKELTLTSPSYDLVCEGNELKVQVRGAALDLVVSDPDDGANLSPCALPLTGAIAVTLTDGSISFRFQQRPRRISLLSLAGEVIIQV